MTEEKFTKLSEEDLDSVVGGGEYHDAYITPGDKPGTFTIKKETFIGDRAAYERFRSGQPMGSIKYTLSTGTSGCSAQLDARIKYLEKQGYTVHKQY